MTQTTERAYQATVNNAPVAAGSFKECRKALWKEAKSQAATPREFFEAATRVTETAREITITSWVLKVGRKTLTIKEYTLEPVPEVVAAPKPRRTGKVKA